MKSIFNCLNCFLITLTIAVSSCGSKNKIENTLEARMFLSSNTWIGDNNAQKALDGDPLKFTDGEATTFKDSYMYNLEKKDGGAGTVSENNYFEITWFDTKLKENIKFYLKENGEGKLVFSRGSFLFSENVSKEITHYPNGEAKKKEEEYYMPMYQAYYAARTATGQETNTKTTDVKRESKLFTGTKKFCQSDGSWYFIVTIEGNKITLKKMPGAKNDYFPDKNTPKEIIEGEIKDGAILTRNEEKEVIERFKYTEGKLYEASYEDSQNEYQECSESSSNVQDTNDFKGVVIGNQIWMTENLNVTTFQNGDVIPEAKSAKDWEVAGQQGKPCWCYYDDNYHNEKKYGKLYNWFAVSDKRGLAPRGWHIPTDMEWRGLMDYLSGKHLSIGETNTAAVKMRNKNSQLGEGGGQNKETNSSGFSALSGGSRGNNGHFNQGACFWSATDYNAEFYAKFGGTYNNEKALYFFLGDTDMRESIVSKAAGFSCRCIKG
jgi:uncharacterized protein (TIGR02145 family)